MPLIWLASACGIVRFRYIIGIMEDVDFLNPLGPLPRGALRHHVVQRLLKAIFGGELAAGTRLIASKLAARLGVSATPIREALVELEHSGIVELQHNRGALVKPFGCDELREFYAIRKLLECEAVRLACGHIDYELLSLLRGDLERLIGSKADKNARWVKDFLAVDQRVHNVVEHCRNKRLIAEIKRYHSLGETLRDIAGHNRAEDHESIVSLAELLEAMQNHQTEEAAAAMGRHISNVAARVERVMFDGKQDSTG